MRARDLLNAIANTLDADTRLAAVEVSIHGGGFTFDELKKYAKRSPAAIVALLKIDAEYTAGATAAYCHFVVVLVTEDRPASEKRDQAIDYSDLLLRIINRSGNRWGLSTQNVGAPLDITARNLYARPLDDQGVAMWAIAWSQQIDLTEETDLAVPLQRINAKWDLSPRDNDAPFIPATGSAQDAENQIEL